jgi:hypothetical protein
MRDVPVVIDYTDYRGYRAMRKILPIRLSFGKYHDLKPEYVIVAVDLDLEPEQVRTFALKNVHSWSQLNE